MKSIRFVGEEINFKKAVADCKRSGRKYVDPDFPPNFDSLWGFGEITMYKKSDWQKYTWRGPEKMYYYLFLRTNFCKSQCAWGKDHLPTLIDFCRGQ